MGETARREEEDMLQQTKEGISEKVNKYKKDVEALSRYLTWLEGKRGQDTFSVYDPGEGEKVTLQVPTYDSTLLGFVKTAKATAFMNRNYPYVYKRYSIQNSKDELRTIDKVQIMDIEVLGAILSKYILKGMTQARVWTEGVQNGVYFAVVSKMKELIEFWTAPI